MSQDSQIPKLAKKDLTDDSLFRLNTNFDLLAQQLTSVQGGNGPVTFRDSITAPSIAAAGPLSGSGQASFTNLRTYPDNATALAGGLAPGDLYQTATGELRIVVA